MQVVIAVLSHNEKICFHWWNCPKHWFETKARISRALV